MIEPLESDAGATESMAPSSAADGAGGPWKPAGPTGHPYFHPYNCVDVPIPNGMESEKDQVRWGGPYLMNG